MNYKLKKRLVIHPIKDELFPELRNRLIIIDHLIRSIAASKAKRKADRVTKQLALATKEAKSKKPRKYTIIPPSNPEEFRR